MTTIRILAGLLAVMLLTAPAAVRPTSASQIAAEEASNVSGCGWCHCCYENCEKTMATGHEYGISAIGYCVSTMCQIVEECTIIIPPLAGERSLPLAVLAQLGVSAAEGDIEDVLAALRDYPSQVHVNVARSSVQVKRCGSYIANLPLSAGDLARVMEIVYGE